MDIYELSLPEYTVDQEPDHETIGAIVDAFIKSHFTGQCIAVRCVGSGEHADKTHDELVAVIKDLGHDRYDPSRPGDRYENNENKSIDIFALPFDVKADSKIFSQFTWPFYHWCIERSGRPVRIDIIIIYDPAKLAQVEFTYAGREHEGVRTDGFVFSEPENKRAALKAIVKIL
jgi:hypothetical protein